MTLSVPSFCAAFTRASMPPTSSAEVADAGSEPPPLPLLLLLLSSSDGGAHAASAVADAIATRVANQILTFTSPPESQHLRSRVADPGGSGCAGDYSYSDRRSRTT